MKHLKLTAPITRWDEAVPLGNGLCGVLLWGDGLNVKLSLDRGDLWDERLGGAEESPLWNCRTLVEAARGRDMAKCRQLCRLAESIPATKLPVGRIELVLAERLQNAVFELDPARATGLLRDGSGAVALSCFCRADGDEIRLSVNVPLRSARIVPPDYQGRAELLQEAGSVRSVGSLGYPAGKSIDSGAVRTYLQPCCEGLSYGILLREVAPGEYVIRILRAGSPEELEMLVADHSARPEQPAEAAFREHRRWWQAFWRRSSVTLPVPRFQQFYELCRYFYGSASRKGAPPMPLQGIWTADDGSLPPWRGDFHHDLNTEFSYIGYLTSGDFDCGESFLDHLVERIPVFRRHAERFFGCPGIAVPGVTSLAGQPLGGWPQYSFSPTAGAWLAALFADHWRYTQDRAFLREKALPFLSGVAEFLLALMARDENGFYKLPVSSSPEIHDETPAAFLTPNSNYDQALLLRLFSDLAELSEAAGDCGEAARWRQELAHLEPLSIDPAEGLMLSPDEFLRESHRHHSHLMALYPLRLLEPAEHEELVANSLRRIDLLGTGGWVGYSFGWMAALNAYCRRGERAARMLRLFLDAFVSPNGFHLNGDYRDLGESAHKYRPFTLEGNFAAMQAIHEMLLQSSGGVIRLFPAIPADWKRISFEELCAEGGIRVSAGLRGGRLAHAVLRSESDRTVRLTAPGIPSRTVRLAAGKPWRWPAEAAGFPASGLHSEAREVING
ncbi:MAG: hypothetical protein HPZ91_04970 [Lentisphaeria bacterium]|nr:hypothetical protein [Lentisphaeria bacterium]